MSLGFLEQSDQVEENYAPDTTQHSTAFEIHQRLYKSVAVG